MHSPPPPTGPLGKFLALIEKGGNALPQPATLFALMAAIVVVVSAIAAELGLSAVHPGTDSIPCATCRAIAATLPWRL